MIDRRRLLLLAPSSGFGGGIERVAAAVERAWQGPVRRVDLYRGGKVPVAAGRPHTKAGFAARALAAALPRPDVILTLHAGILPIAHMVGRATGARVAVMGIGLEVWAPMSRLERETIARCDHLMAISSFTAKWMAERAGIPEERIAVVPLPVEPAFEAVARDVGDGPAKREPTLLTVSRIVPENRYKGHFAIVAAMPAVLARRPDARWLVVGDGDDLPRLRDACISAGIEQCVDLRGSIGDDELLAAYRQACALVLPSSADPQARPPEGEGFGLVYVEAACFGLASIASSVGGGSLDFVEHGVTGLTVPPGDERALSDAMLALLDDGELRERLGAGAHARACDRHLESHFAAALAAQLAW